MHQKLSTQTLNRISVEKFKEQKKQPIILVLDNIRSLNNIGSAFRTSDAFLIEAIYLCGITAQPPHREIRKTALGATESVAWKYFPNTLEAIEMLKKQNRHIISIEQTTNSTLLQDFKLDTTQQYALVFGNEVKGVQQEIINESNSVIEIPQFGTKHSLNISVSLGIILWDFTKTQIQKNNF